MTQSTITWPVHGNLRIHSLARSTCHLIKSLPITYPKSSGTAPIHDELPIDYWALCTYTITFPYPILHSILIYILTYYIPFSLPNSGHHHANDKRHQFISTGHETMYMKCMQNMEPNMASTQIRRDMYVFGHHDCQSMEKETGIFNVIWAVSINNEIRTWWLVMSRTHSSERTSSS